MTILVILGWIFIGIICLFALLLAIVWLFLPLYYRKSYSKELDGSYNPHTDLWRTPLVLPEKGLSESVTQSLGASLKKTITSPKLEKINATQIQFKWDELGSFTNLSLRVHLGDKKFTPEDVSDQKIEAIHENETITNFAIGNGKTLQKEWQITLGNKKLRILTSIHALDSYPGYICELELPDGFDESFPSSNTELGNKSSTQEWMDKLNFLFPVFTNDSIARRMLTFQETVFAPPTNHFTTAFAPVVLFNDLGQCIVLCALDHYFVTGCQCRRIADDKYGARFEYGFGIKNTTHPLPKGYRQRCVIFRCDGIAESIQQVGKFLRQFHNLPSKSMTPDPLNKWLGYFTDNGAAYYYNTVKGVKADETLRLVEKRAQELKIPYHYYHLDSWWYQKSTSPRKQRYLGKLSSLLGGSLYGGTLLWEIDPHYFDTPLSDLSKQLGKPFSAHNRWYETGSPYTNQFKFHTRGIYAMPDDQAFFDKLMRECRENQIIVYEQDWISTQFKRFPYFASELGACERWLDQMGSAAAKYDRTIQYCMETPASIMYSQFIPCVTHGRACDDYHGWAYHNYDVPAFTQASILLDAMGLRPFKDVFKTTKRGRYRGENNPLLMSIVASLSTGPVGPGDEIGYENVDLIMASCTANGLLLQPDRPLFAADKMFLPHTNYFTAATYSRLGDLCWWYVLTANLFPDRVQKTAYLLADMIPHMESPTMKWIEYDWKNHSTRFVDHTANIDLKLKSDEFKYYIYAPFLSNGAAIIGTPAKICMVNQNYLKNFEVRPTGLTLLISSPSPENLDFMCIIPQSSHDVKVVDNNIKIPISFDLNPNSGLLMCHLLLQDSNLHQIVINWII